VGVIVSEICVDVGVIISGYYPYPYTYTYSYTYTWMVMVSVVTVIVGDF